MFVDVFVRLSPGEQVRVTRWFIDPTEQVYCPQRVGLEEVIPRAGLHRGSPSRVASAIDPEPRVAVDGRSHHSHWSSRFVAFR